MAHTSWYVTVSEMIFDTAKIEFVFNQVHKKGEKNAFY